MSERKKVCLDPGHDAGNLANRSPDGTYYEHEFCLDMGRRIRDILERHGVAVTMTRDGGGAVSLAERCAIANSIPGLDLFVSLHSNAAAGSGWSSASGWSSFSTEVLPSSNPISKIAMDTTRPARYSMRPWPKGCSSSAA